MKSTDYKDYEVPRGKIDETGQIVIKGRGINYYGCPNCGACFVWDCFCGFASEKKHTIDTKHDDYLYSDEFHKSAEQWDKEHTW